MWTCRKCKAEVEDNFEACWSCGTSREGVENPDFVPEREGVISEEEYQAEAAARATEDLVTVETFWSAPEAHMACSLLEAEGIKAFVTDELETTTLPLVRGTVTVQVPAHDAERARKVLAEVRHKEPP